MNTIDSEITSSLAFAKHMDNKVWQTVFEWRSSHLQLHNISRCCATLIINKSENPIQILKTTLQEGKNFIIIGSAMKSSFNGNGSSYLNEDVGYDEESRTIMSGGGAVLIFAYGYVPSIIDSAQIQMVVNTSAFNATVSTYPNRTVCFAVGGYTVGYLEKSLSKYWAKYVIAIS